MNVFLHSKFKKPVSEHKTHHEEERGKGEKRQTHVQCGEWQGSIESKELEKGIGE